MGELKSCLAKVSSDYDNYLFTIVNEYGNTAEKVLAELFGKMSTNIGENNVVVKPINEGIREAEELFELDVQDKRPVIVITGSHVDKLIELKKKGKSKSLGNEINFIKIPLGKIEDDSKIR